MRAVLLAAAGVGLAAAWPAGDALGWVQSESSGGQGLHWTDPCITVYLHEAGSDEVGGEADIDAEKASLKTWSQVECSAASVQFGGRTNATVTGYFEEEVPMNMIIFREKAWPYSERPVAYTSVTYDPKTGVIVDADIEMNGEDYAFTADGENEPWKIDIQNTVTHELGHVLGLDHSDDPAATMFKSAEPGETYKSTLSEDDTEGICTLYRAVSFQACQVVEPLDVYIDEEPTFGEEQGACSMGTQGQDARGATGGSAGFGFALLLVASLAPVFLMRKSRSPLRGVQLRIDTARAPSERRAGRGNPAASASSCFVVAAALAIVAAPSDAAAWHFASTESGATVHWKPADCAVEYYMEVEGIPGIEADEEFPAIEESIATWNSAECTPVEFKLAGYKADPTWTNDGENVIIFVDADWADVKPDEDISSVAAFTVMTYEVSSGELVDTDMTLNLELFEFSLCDEGEDPGPLDLRHVVLHEAGHMLGLDHTEDPLAVMWAQPKKCEEPAPTFLTQDDLGGLCWYYGSQEWLEGWDDSCLGPGPDQSVEQMEDVGEVGDATETAAPEVTSDSMLEDGKTPGDGKIPGDGASDASADGSGEGDPGGTGPDCGCAAASSGQSSACVGAALLLLVVSLLGVRFRRSCE